MMCSLCVVLRVLPARPQPLCPPVPGAALGSAPSARVLAVPFSQRWELPKGFGNI